MNKYLFIFIYLYLTPIREFWTENPQTGNIQERHLWTENPHEILRKFCFGNVMERHLLTENPLKSRRSVFENVLECHLSLTLVLI